MCHTSIVEKLLDGLNFSFWAKSEDHFIDHLSSVSLSYSVFGFVTGSWFHDNGATEEQYLPNTFSEADNRTEEIAFNDGTFNSLSICLEEHQ